MSGRGSVPLAVLAAVVAGCATPPALVDTSRVVSPTQTETLEQVYRQRAVALTGERRWADAAVQWELLTLLRPDSTEYRTEADAARGRSADAAAAHVRTAEQARKRGDNERAMTSYLRALSADPGNAAAAAGLKAIEIEHTRRAWLSRPPRIPYVPPGAPVQPPPYDPTTDDTGPRR